jgi:hypothetical protein
MCSEHIIIVFNTSLYSPTYSHTIIQAIHITYQIHFPWNTKVNIKNFSKDLSTSTLPCITLISVSQLSKCSRPFLIFYTFISCQKKTINKCCFHTCVTSNHGTSPCMKQHVAYKHTPTHTHCIHILQKEAL